MFYIDCLVEKWMNEKWIHLFSDVNVVKYFTLSHILWRISELEQRSQIQIQN